MAFENLTTVTDRVLVHMPDRHVTHLKVADLILYFDASWNEQGNKDLRGVVVAAPPALSDDPLLWRDKAPPEHPRWHCARKHDIVDELRVGDLIYCDVSVSEPTFELPGYCGVYRADVNQVVAIVREGKIIPYGSYVLMLPVWPDDVEEVEVLGKKLHLRVSKSGLTMGSEDIPPVRYQGLVKYVGEPLRNQPNRVAPGDVVALNRDMCGNGGVDGYEGLPLRVTIEGTTYYCIRQDFIMAVKSALRFNSPRKTKQGHVNLHECAEVIEFGEVPENAYDSAKQPPFFNDEYPDIRF